MQMLGHEVSEVVLFLSLSTKRTDKSTILVKHENAATTGVRQKLDQIEQ